jgi:hypothetical protein
MEERKEAEKTPAEVAMLAKQGIIAAMPKKHETPEEAVARVQKRHPGKRVVDPEPPHMKAVNGNGDFSTLELAARTIKFREALGRTKGFGNICRMGHKLMPKPICNRPVAELPGNYLDNTEEIGEVPESWKQPYSICSARWHKGRLRRGFSLVEIRKNRVKSIEQVGRKWTPYFQGEFRVDRGAEWGSKFLKLEPVFAGLGSETLERTALNALSALPYAFAGARASDFSEDARHAVHGLTRRPYNAVRLLTRLAVMWIGATLCEQESRRLTLAGYGTAPAVRYIRSCGDMSIGLTDAIDARAQTLYVEMGRIGRDPVILSVLFAAMVREPHWRTVMSTEDVPSILKLWPDIPHPQLSVYGRDEAIIHAESLSATSIWMAIEVVVQQMALRDLWNEVLHSVAALALRPEGDTIFCGHQAVKMSLPESSMGPAALGPVMENARHWEDEALPVVQPTIPELMWTSSARYAMWALAYRDLCAACGGNEGHVFTPDSGQAKRIEWTLNAGTTVVAGNKICEKIAEDYGWESLLGRILRTVCGLTKSSMLAAPKMYANTALVNPGALQWEEVLPYVERLPEGSAALSLIYPAKAHTMPIAGQWTAPLNVVNRHGLSDAMYTMGKMKDCKLGYAVFWQSVQKFRVLATRPVLSYRGAMADAQFFASRDEDGMFIEPVFKFHNHKDAICAYHESIYNYESDWYLEHEVDQSFDGLLSHFLEMDRLIGPKPPGIEMGDGALDGEDELDEGPETTVVTVEQETVPGRPASPDQPTYEQKMAGDGKRIRTMPDSMRFFNTQREIITRVMEEEPEWVQFISEIKHLRGNPLEQKDEIARIAQLVMQRLRGMDPTLLPHAATDQTRIPQMMRGCAYMLKEFAAFVSGHDATQLMLRMAEGCRCVARSFELGEGIFDNVSYSIIHNRQLPEHVSKPDFDKGIRMGMTIGDLVFSRDYEHLQRLLGEAEAAMTTKLEADTTPDVTGAYTPVEEEITALQEQYEWVKVSGLPQPEPEKGESKEQASGSGQQTAEDTQPPQAEEKPDPKMVDESKEEEQLLETRPEVVATEAIPPSSREAPFGGDQPSPDAGGEDQPPPDAAATSAEGHSGPIARISFQTRSGPEE